MTKRIPFLLLFVAILLPGFLQAQLITTIAGDSTAGYNGDGIAATAAALHYPQCVATDQAGNVYIGDAGNNRIRKIDASGIITTYAGTGVAGYSGDGGPASAANLNARYMAADNAGNLYFSDPIYNHVRKINSAGVVSSIAGTDVAGYSGDDGPATDAQLSQPAGIAADGNGNIFIADAGNGRVRKISAAGIISTVAGGGIASPGDGGAATSATLYQPNNITIDGAGNIYVICGNQVRKISAAGIISTFAGTAGPGSTGDGRAATASILAQPSGIAADGAGNVYVSEIFYNRVRKINTDGIISTIAGANRRAGYNGDGITATSAWLYMPVSLAIDAPGNIFIADYYNGRVRCIRSGIVTNMVSDAVPGEISIYPNPGHGHCTVNLTSTRNAAVRITVMNIAGEIVKEYTTVTNQAIDVETGTAPGIYYIMATTAEGSLSRQIIVN